MRVYGGIKTNLGKEYDDNLNISIDVLSFETPEGKLFDIDFDEGDYNIKDGVINFRLKGLGDSFSDRWYDLDGRNNDKILENDIEFFKQCKLYEMQVYIPEELPENFEIKVTYVFINIQDTTHEYDKKEIILITTGG